MFVTEKARETEVIADVDVLVVGGGPGGVPAAIAAARRGQRVLIAERYGFLGGLGVYGLMDGIFGYSPIESEPPHKPVLGGIPAEIIKRLQKAGGAPDDDSIDWARVQFDSEIMKSVLEKMLTESGGEILYHSVAANVIMNENMIDCVIFQTKSGRAAIRAKMVIDATGDGDIAALAGESYEKGRAADGLMQAFGTKFIIGGVRDNAVDICNASAPDAQPIRKKICDAIGAGAINAYSINVRPRTHYKDMRIFNVTRTAGDSTDFMDLTRAEQQLRDDSFKILHFYKQNVPGYEDAFIIETPVQVGVRETRRIVCEKTLKFNDVINMRKCADSIARGCWHIDIHCPRGICSRYVETNTLCNMECKVDCYMKDNFAAQMPKSEYA